MMHKDKHLLNDLTSNFSVVAMGKMPRLKILLAQYARTLLKKTIWNAFTTALYHIGLPVRTVQVIVADRKAHQVLLLITREYACGYSLVQGIRKQLRLIPPRFKFDPAVQDARRELFEEGIKDLLPEYRFRFIKEYREGRYGQFPCSIFVVEGSKEEFRLHDETAEGLPVWMNEKDAAVKLDNPVLTPIITQTELSFASAKQHRAVIKRDVNKYGFGLSFTLAG